MWQYNNAKEHNVKSNTVQSILYIAVLFLRPNIEKLQKNIYCNTKYNNTWCKSTPFYVVSQIRRHFIKTVTMIRNINGRIAAHVICLDIFKRTIIWANPCGAVVMFDYVSGTKHVAESQLQWVRSIAKFSVKCYLSNNDLITFTLMVTMDVYTIPRCLHNTTHTFELPAITYSPSSLLKLK